MHLLLQINLNSNYIPVLLNHLFLLHSACRHANFQIGSTRCTPEIIYDRIHLFALLSFLYDRAG
jgi:hypothetical protein